MALPKITALYFEARELAPEVDRDVYLKTGARLGDKHTQSRLWKARVRTIIAYAPTWTKVWVHGHDSSSSKTRWVVTDTRTDAVPTFYEQARATKKDVELAVVATRFAHAYSHYMTNARACRMKLYESHMREASGIQLLESAFEVAASDLRVVMFDPVALAIPASETNIEKLENRTTAPWPLLLKAKACYKKHNIEV